jgi:hypothetical protein
MAEVIPLATLGPFIHISYSLLYLSEAKDEDVSANVNVAATKYFFEIILILEVYLFGRVSKKILYLNCDLSRVRDLIFLVQCDTPICYGKWGIMLVREDVKNSLLLNKYEMNSAVYIMEHKSI